MISGVFLVLSICLHITWIPSIIELIGKCHEASLADIFIMTDSGHCGLGKKEAGYGRAEEHKESRLLTIPHETAHWEFPPWEGDTAWVAW